MDNEFQPFANESDVIRIGGLEIENRVDRLTLTGDLVLSRDRVGLALARELHALLGRAIATMESDPGLPERIEVLPARSVSNPFS
ncbi:hypothetical protein [Malikia sp.]|uniref:hypothetical protein n=1 Tax=Malikia sp. TaxID=2070706 RepID=UPI0026070E96|nr:hypothetical protein [Malikia sp.]MDD2729537.1 hypothetical protein [Malikia sp.]